MGGPVATFAGEHWQAAMQRNKPMRVVGLRGLDSRTPQPRGCVLRWIASAAVLRAQ